MSTQPEPQAPIKGSWEALLQEAQGYAINFNDAAIPIFEKIVTRLRKIPKAQRYAGNRRLQNIWLQAAIDLHAYLSMRERYLEAVELVDEIETEVDGEDYGQWEGHAARLLLQAGDEDGAIARLQALTDRPESDLSEWVELATLYIRLGQMDEADRVLQRMGEWVDEHHEAESEASARDRAVVLSIRSMRSLESGQADEAVELLDRAIALDDEMNSRAAMTYIRLIRHREYEPALTLIQRERPPTIRSKFWQAVTLFRQGKTREAETIWREIGAKELDEEEYPAIMEYILSLYHLGDPNGEGLSNILALLNEDSSQFWGIYFLAGLGWALRDNMANARSDFETAMLQRRAAAEGRLIPYESWSYCQDILPEETQAQIAEYFETDGDIGDKSGGYIDETDGDQ